MRKFLNYFLAAVFILFSLFLAVFLVRHEHYFLLLINLIITAITMVIIFHRKAYPFRFLYPGLITFLIFMILPILFTIYISFTNLSTGHYLSQAEVKNQLEREMYIPEGRESSLFKLYDKGEGNYNLSMVANSKVYLAEFNINDSENEISLLESRDVYLDDPLSNYQVFQLRDQLRKIRFNLNGINYHYFRSNTLAPLEKRYIIGDHHISDKKTGVRFEADYQKGQYISGDIALSPGFFTQVGVHNFTKIVTDSKIKSSFAKVLIWTLIWATATVAMTFTVGLFLALIVNDKALRFKAFYRTLLIIPYSIPFFISVLIFKGLMNKDFGALNQMLGYVGVAPIGWLETPTMAKISCLLVNLWLGFPYMFLVTTGIIQSIPNSVYEAAKMDGASRWQSFRYVTLPLITSAITPLLIGSFSFNLNNFVGIYLLTGGGPPIQGSVTPVGETDILISYTYRLAFEGGQGQDFGLASSIAMFIFVIITILTIINFRVTGMMQQQEAAR